MPRNVLFGSSRNPIFFIEFTQRRRDTARLALVAPSARKSAH